MSIENISLKILNENLTIPETIKTKHLIFIVIGKKPKTKVYSVISNYDDTVLGEIYWYGKWRQYIFEPDININTIWSDECLLELYGFIHNLRLERKKNENKS